MPLTDLAIRTAKPGPRAVKMFDERGLYVQINPTGSKWWRVKYQFAGKAQLLSVGVYPEVSLKEARQRRDAIRRQVRDGIDPSAARKATRQRDTGADSFAALADEWRRKFQADWAPSYREKIAGILDHDLLPWLGPRPVKAIEPREVLAVARRIESRGALETAHRTVATAGRIFRYGVATGRADRDPTPDLRGALPPLRNQHFAAITDPMDIGHLLRAIDGYTGTFIVKTALRLAPRLFVRPGELRKMEWTELNLDAGEWRIPGPKMKMREAHLVPLATQCIAILQEIQPLTGASPFVFPNLRTPGLPLSEVALLSALRRLGYGKEQMTVHGFRAMASTILHEQGFLSDVIERQLAHAERNSIKAAYCRAEHLPERRRMMQAWSDYLDGLTQGGVIIPIRRKLSTTCG